MQTWQPQAVANTIWAFAHLGHVPSRALLTAMEARIVATAGSFEPIAISSVLWGMATLHLCPSIGVCACACSSVCVCARTHAHCASVPRVHLCICLCMCIHAHTHTHTHTHTHITHAHTYPSHTHTHTHTRARAHTHTHSLPFRLDWRDPTSGLVCKCACASLLNLRRSLFAFIRGAQQQVGTCGSLSKLCGSLLQLCGSLSETLAAFGAL